ncbi:MAG TPA: DUF4260 family protein [Thermomicrobiales bacterium]|nr:DUF4260 family protein [Thermomicrobiales bacterium]
MFCNQTISDRLVEATNAGRSRFAGRFAWGVASVSLLAATMLQIQDHGGGWLALGFALMPDLGLLAGAARGLEKGQLAPRAVPIYNALHRLFGPAMLGLLVLAGVLPAVWLSAALGWALHIALDRTVGYGLRDADGFQRS